jgi:HAD superfamily hydrolase (TIGR01509 family)
VTARAALWDLDGTLVDSEEAHFGSWRDALRREGFELTRERFRDVFGRRNDATLRLLLGEDLSDAELDRIADAKESAYRAEVRRAGARLLPGAATWLDRLAANGWRQAIVSSAPGANVATLVEALDVARYFGTIVAAEDVRVGKPDPEGFLLAASRLGATPVSSVVLEDAPHGITAARRAGMRSVGVLTTHRSLDADVVVASLGDLVPDALDRLVGP